MNKQEKHVLKQAIRSCIKDLSKSLDDVNDGEILLNLQEKVKLLQVLVKEARIAAIEDELSHLRQNAELPTQSEKE